MLMAKTADRLHDLKSDGVKCSAGVVELNDSELDQVSGGLDPRVITNEFPDCGKELNDMNNGGTGDPQQIKFFHTIITRIKGS